MGRKQVAVVYLQQRSKGRKLPSVELLVSPRFPSPTRQKMVSSCKGMLIIILVEISMLFHKILEMQSSRLKYTRQQCSVAPFLAEYDETQNIDIVTGATAVDLEDSSLCFWTRFVVWRPYGEITYKSKSM